MRRFTKARVFLESQLFDLEFFVKPELLSSRIVVVRQTTVDKLIKYEAELELVMKLTEKTSF